MTEEALSQEEIDALLTGVDDGDVEIDPESGPSAIQLQEAAEPYDLSVQERSVRGKMPTLGMINTRFARLTRISLFNLLRHSPIVTVGEIQTITFGEYVSSLAVPTSVNLVKVKPLRGIGMFVLDAELVFQLVDRYFGGDGSSEMGEGRDFTPTEARVVQRTVENAFADMTEAWSKVYELDFEYVGSEMNPALANIVGSEEMVVVSSFRIDMDGTGGEFHFAVPYSMIEPLRKLLDADTQSADETEEDWRSAIQARTLSASVPLNCTIAERYLSLRDVLALKPGDVIPVDLPDDYSLTANRVPLFQAALGKNRGNLALRITADANRPH